MKRTLIALVLAATAALALPVAAFAAGNPDGRIVLGGSYTLASGDTLEGDLLILGGNVTLEEGSVVQGNVALLGGNVSADGEIDGDVALVGGNISLGSTALVTGNITTFGGSVNRAPGAQVRGEILTGQGFALPFNLRGPFTFGFPFRFSPLEMMPFFVTNVISRILWFVFEMLLLAALAVVVVMFWPQATGRVAKAVVDQPILTGGLGLLTLVVLPIVVAGLVITVCLIPVAAISVLLLGIALLFGVIGIGLEVGQRLARLFKGDLHPAAAAGLGTLVVGVVAGGIGNVPCVGWVAPLVVASLGLGAVIVTRFGSREYIPAGPAPAPMAPPAPPAPPLPPAPAASLQPSAGAGAAPRARRPRTAATAKKTPRRRTTKS
jgi:hypothetical protein